MRGVDIQRAKLKRIIDSQGKSYKVYRDGLNKLKEPDGSRVNVATIFGLWHESQGYVTVTKDESAKVRSKPYPQILILYDGDLDIRQDDYVLVGDVKYTVTGVHDPTNLGIALDISLEVGV